MRRTMLWYLFMMVILNEYLYSMNYIRRWNVMKSLSVNVLTNLTKNSLIHSLIWIKRNVQKCHILKNVKEVTQGPWDGSDLRQPEVSIAMRELEEPLDRRKEERSRKADRINISTQDKHRGNYRISGEPEEKRSSYDASIKRWKN